MTHIIGSVNSLRPGLSVYWFVGWLVGLLSSFLKKGGKLHFHARIVARVNV